MQEAIWYLEDEIPAVTDPLNPFLYGANGAITLFGLAGAKANNTYDSTVVVLNLWNADGSPAQDQLTVVPEASTMIAGALLVLPLGASALRVLRKNRTA